MRKVINLSGIFCFQVDEPIIGGGGGGGVGELITKILRYWSSTVASHETPWSEFNWKLSNCRWVDRCLQANEQVQKVWLDDHRG